MDDEFSQGDAVEGTMVEEQPVEQEPIQQESSEQSTVSDYSEPSPNYEEDYGGDEGLDLSSVLNSTLEESGNPFVEKLSELGFEAENLEHAQESLLSSYQTAYDYNQQWQDYYHKQQEEAQQRVQQQQAQQQQMHQMQQQQQQMRQMAEAGEVFQQMSNDPKFREWAYETYGGERPPQEQQPEQWWAPPQLDQEEVKRWRYQAQNPATGQWSWQWKPNAPRELVDNAERFVDYHQDWQSQIMQKPQEVLPKIIEQEFDKLFVDRYGALMNHYQEEAQQQTLQHQAADINNRNADWVYQKDQGGNFLRDQTGQLVLTNEGNQVIQNINGLRQQGINDPNQLWQLASQLLAGNMAQQRLQTQTHELQAARASQARNMRHLQRGAGYIPNREGSQAPPENPSPYSQNQLLTAGDKLRQQALSDGLF